MTALKLLVALCAVGTATAQFDRNVIMLDNAGWKDMLASPHGFVCKFCVCIEGSLLCLAFQMVHQFLPTRMRLLWPAFSGMVRVFVDEFYYMNTYTRITVPTNVACLSAGKNWPKK